MTTILLVGVLLVFSLYLNGTTLAVIGDPRGAVLVIGALGLGMCIVGGRADSMSHGLYTVAQSVLGVVSLAIILIGLATGAAWTVTALTVLVAVMWVATIIRRLAARPVHAPTGA